MPGIICGKNVEKYLDELKEKCLLINSVNTGCVVLYDYDKGINVSLKSSDKMFDSNVNVDYQQAKELADFIYKRLELHKEIKNEG